MNVRGYTGAVEAYVGLGETDSEMAILEKGAQEIPSTNICSQMKKFWRL